MARSFYYKTLTWLRHFKFITSCIIKKGYVDTHFLLPKGQKHVHFQARVLKLIKLQEHAVKMTKSDQQLTMRLEGLKGGNFIEQHFPKIQMLSFLFKGLLNTTKILSQCTKGLGLSSGERHWCLGETLIVGTIIYGLRTETEGFFPERLHVVTFRSRIATYRCGSHLVALFTKTPNLDLQKINVNLNYSVKHGVINVSPPPPPHTHLPGFRPRNPTLQITLETPSVLSCVFSKPTPSNLSCYYSILQVFPHPAT